MPERGSVVFINKGVMDTKSEKGSKNKQMPTSMNTNEE